MKRYFKDIAWAGSGLCAITCSGYAVATLQWKWAFVGLGFALVTMAISSYEYYENEKGLKK